MISRERCLEWMAELLDTELSVAIEDIANRAYAEGQKDLGACKCDFRGKLLGDGCSVCNPTMARNIAAYNEGYRDGQKDAKELLHYAHEEIKMLEDEGCAVHANDCPICEVFKCL